MHSLSHTHTHAYTGVKDINKCTVSDHRFLKMFNSNMHPQARLIYLLFQPYQTNWCRSRHAFPLVCWWDKQAFDLPSAILSLSLSLLVTSHACIKGDTLVNPHSVSHCISSNAPSADTGTQDLSWRSSWIANGKDTTTLWFTENGLPPSAPLLPAATERQRRDWSNIKGERVKRYVYGERVIHSVCVCVFVCLFENDMCMCLCAFMCVKEREEEKLGDIIWSYWKIKEKVILHAVHLPVCLKGLSARMINQLDKWTHTTMLCSFFFSNTRGAACAILWLLCVSEDVKIVSFFFSWKISCGSEEKGRRLIYCGHNKEGTKICDFRPTWKVFIII